MRQQYTGIARVLYKGSIPRVIKGKATFPRGDSDSCDRGNLRKPAASAGENRPKNASKSQICGEKGRKVPGTLWEGAKVPGTLWVGRFLTPQYDLFVL